MRKRRATFYAHLKRMNKERLTKQIFDFFDKNAKSQITWLKEVKTDLREMNISESDIEDRNLFRQKIQLFPGFVKKRKK